MFKKIQETHYFENLLISEQSVIKPRDLGRDSVSIHLNSDMTSFNIDASAGLGKKIRKSIGKVIIKEKEILQYNMKGLSLSYRKKRSSTSFSLRNVLECPFNMTYSIFGPIIKNFFIEDINHSIEKDNILEEQSWKKYKKSANYRIKSTKKATFNFNFTERDHQIITETQKNRIKK